MWFCFTPYHQPVSDDGGRVLNHFSRWKCANMFPSNHIPCETREDRRKMCCLEEEKNPSTLRPAPAFECLFWAMSPWCALVYFLLALVFAFCFFPLGYIPTPRIWIKLPLLFLKWNPQTRKLGHLSQSHPTGRITCSTTSTCPQHLPFDPTKKSKSSMVGNVFEPPSFFTKFALIKAEAEHQHQFRALLFVTHTKATAGGRMVKIYAK